MGQKSTSPSVLLTIRHHYTIDFTDFFHKSQ